MLNVFEDKSNVTFVGVMLSDTDIQNLGFVVKPNTDFFHPIEVAKHLFSDKKYLLIDKGWFLQHQNDSENLINEIICNSPSEEFTICDNLLFFPSIVSTLCKNKNIESVNLGSMVDGHVLSKEEYEKLKNAGKESIYIFDVDDALMDVDDPLIKHIDITLIGDYRYSDFTCESGKTIEFKKQLTDQEINYLKFISDDKPIILSNDCVFQTDKICKKLCELNKNNQVIVDIKDKRNFNNYVFNHEFLYNNLFIKYDLMTIDIKKYFELEKLLYMMVEPAMHLSPFEKYLYAYNIVKHYKKYQESNLKNEKSRNIYHILENEFIVCLGFSNFLGDLLDKLNIPNFNLDIEVDLSYDEIKPGQEEITTEEKVLQNEGHARRYVYLVDPKYGIDGFFYGDPTWDNSLEKDLYNYAVMTDEEATKARRYIAMSITSTQELFNIHSIEEFYNKINFLIGRNQEKVGAIFSCLKDIVYDLIEKIKKLDESYIKSLELRYPFISGIKSQFPDDVSFLLEEVGSYIVEHVNKEVSGKTIMEAVETMYRELNVFPEDRIDIELETIREDNSERQAKAFPPRHKYYADGTVVYDAEWHNKFVYEDEKKIA